MTVTVSLKGLIEFYQTFLLLLLFLLRMILLSVLMLSDVSPSFHFAVIIRVTEGRYCLHDIQHKIYFSL